MDETTSGQAASQHLSSSVPRHRRFATAAILVAAALASVAMANANDTEQIDEPEVCTSTVYEGCPGRWEAEWATPTG